MVYFVRESSDSSFKVEIGINLEIADFCALCMLPYLSHQV